MVSRYNSSQLLCHFPGLRTLLVIDIIGVHYPCTGGDGGSNTSYLSTNNAISLGKQLWVTAHITQLTQPGWHYLATASGYLGF